MKRFAFLAALAAVVCATFAAAAPPAHRNPAPPPKPALVDFAVKDPVFELRDELKPYRPPAGAREAKGERWYLLAATNSAIRPASRVFQAVQPQSVSFRLLPAPTRPAILRAASSDLLVTIENVNAYGRRSFRITVPPASNVAIAIELSNMAQPPSVLAWTEPALAAHNRQLAIFTTAVWALIAAAALIAAGLAVTLGHAPARWAAIALLFVLLERLSETGLFDGSLATKVGGPYGLMAMLSGLSLWAGACLADAIVPVQELWPNVLTWFRRSLWALVALSILAYLGIPAMAVLADTLVVLGSVAVAAYVILRGHLGAQAARVAAPAALAFALVTLCSALATLNNSGDSWASSAAGGFAAAGSLLLALAVAAGEGIAVLPFASVAAATESDLDPFSFEDLPERRLLLRSGSVVEAIAAAHQGVFDLDFKSGTLKLSREAAALIGLPESSHRVKHDAWLARMHEDDRPVYEEGLSEYRRNPGQAFRIEFRVRNQASRYRWLELRATMLGEHPPAVRCLGLVADVTLRKESEAELLSKTLRDPLTGLGNRQALLERLNALGPQIADATLVVLDLDRFKAIHASLGDRGGDAVLIETAERLGTAFGSSATVYRIGGDLFALLFDRKAEVAALQQELPDLLAEPHRLNDRDVFAPASAGIASGAADTDSLMRNAERAMVEAKKAGGDCARLFSDTATAPARTDTVLLEADLRRAIEGGEIEVHYQPIVRLEDNALAGFEALLRWNHPERSTLQPFDIVAHAEETGTILALGRFVLERSAQRLAEWQRFFPRPEPLFVSVNVSRRQLRDVGFPEFLRDLLASEPVAEKSLRLEITESAVAAYADVQAALAQCRALGVPIALDDFGTGASSLSELKSFAFDSVKIDGSFLNRHTDPVRAVDSDKVFASIVRLAHDLGRSVVAEGVEDEKDTEWLRALGCEYAQGYVFSPPLSAEEAVKFIALHVETPAPSGAPRLRGQA